MLAGCGGGAKHYDPNAPRLITKSLEKAREQSSVRYHVDLALGAKLGPDTRSSGLPAEQLESLAENPFRLTLDGVRSRTAFTADGTLEAGGGTHPFSVRQLDGRLFLRLDDTWYRLRGTLGQVFQPESFANLIPQEACFNHDISEGCDEVDFGPALERGDIGRSVKGSVDRSSDETVISGTLDAAGFERFQTYTPSGALRPYEQSGHVEFSIGKDGLPRRFLLSYRLDADALKRHLRGTPAPVTERDARFEIDLSDWGTAVHVEPPSTAASLPNQQAGRIYDGIFAALVLYR